MEKSFWINSEYCINEFLVPACVHVYASIKKFFRMGRIGKMMIRFIIFFYVEDIIAALFEDLFNYLSYPNHPEKNEIKLVSGHKHELFLVL